MSLALENGVTSVTVLLTNGESARFEDLDHVSIVNAESFGPVTNLGVIDVDGNRTLILRDFAAVEIEV